MDKHIKKLTPIALLLAFALSSCAENKTSINIAVASNFEQTLNKIVEKYHKNNNSDFNINIIAASSGVLSTQIVNNAPFDLFLSADDSKPHILKKQLEIHNNVTVYAIGQLVLWIPNSDQKQNCLEQLSTVKTLAIANPKTAPYGQLAVNILEGTDIKIEKIIHTGNVSQAYLYTKDGLTQAGFVAKSLMEKDSQGCIQTFDDSLLNQSMLLINDKARAFYEFLLTDEIQEFIKESGYKILHSNNVQ